MAPHFDDLLARYLEGRLVIFVGSGVSHAGGLPSWDGLIRRLIAGARASDTDPHALAEADAALARGDMTRALGAVQATMSGTAYGRVVARAFDDSGHPVPPLARAIADLAPTLHAVVTTNLDRFLERAFAGDWPCYTLPKLDLGQQRHYILQLHGTRTDRGSWVLSEHEYESLLHGRPELQRFVEGLYCFHTLLFVGYGLHDPDFDRLCGHLRALSRSQTPQHYALVPDRALGPYERRRFAEAGIELIAYENSDGSHAELLRLLGDLSASRPGVGAVEADHSRASVTDEASAVMDEDRSRSLPALPAAPPPRPWYTSTALVAGLAASSTLATITAYIAPSFLPETTPADLDVPQVQALADPDVTQVQAPRLPSTATVHGRVDPGPAALPTKPAAEGLAERSAFAASSASSAPKLKRCAKAREQQLILWLGLRPNGVDRAHRLDLTLTFNGAGDVQARASPEDSPLWPTANRRLAEFAELRELRNCRMDTTWDP